MRRLPPVLLLLLLLLALPACQQAPAQSAGGWSAQALPPIEVYFSPKGGCTEAVVRELAVAKSAVLVQAYNFTSAPISKALLAAHKRGVKVQVILDKSQRTEKYSEADFLVNVGIPVQIDAKHAIAHNKVMVIDGQTVITGSFNFTTAAEEHNAENLLVIRDATLAAKYATNWKVHADHSDSYAGRTEGYSQTHRAESAKPALPVTNPVTEGYVASKNSQVFHKAGCKSAAKISEKNLVRFNSRDEAVQAGKKPCHECNP
jgi:phosphatidylserine/phosphatidylglycerophosphate/cardiolipin synthase-like enzyme